MKRALVLRFLAFVVLAASSSGLAGCDKVEVTGRYRDASHADLIYEFRPDGTWTATWENKVPLGMFAQGAARRIGGTYEIRGRHVRLTCLTVEERDPVGGHFHSVRVFDGDNEALRRAYDHGFEAGDEGLRPQRADHPFGGGLLVPERGVQ